MRSRYRRSFLLAAALILAFAAIVSAQARKPAPRSITVVTEPNSTVWIDGVRYGVTDDKGRFTISSVTPGVRSMRVRANGFSEAVKMLPAASSGDVPIKLTPTTDAAELAFPRSAERRVGQE